jgi:hypothetical protein
MQDVLSHPAAALNVHNADNFVRLDRDECKALGAKLHDQYCSAEPFPHIVLDDFLPRETLRRMVAEFPEPEPGRFADSHSKLKTGYQLDKIKSPFTNGVINALNSAPFLDFLVAMTGIQGLMADPYQIGGGLHETRRGGHLSIHADFNMHPSLRVKRRLNLILFLNEDWEDSFGGHLELWTKDMSRCAERVLPVIGRAVVFNTDSDSFHGHPEPLTCPEDRTRRSLALYYYAADAELLSLQQARTTNFKKRPASNDKVDLKWKIDALVKDLCPPILYRAFSRKA